MQARGGGNVSRVPVTHDAVVVGGGPAGLAAATWLARYRRDVVIVDSGDYRAAPVATSHGYLARDPQDPMDFLRVASHQLERYRTVTRRPGTVVDARTSADGFVLTCADGTTLHSMRVVLATGVVDACPDLEGFAEHYGRSAFHCPACDGYDAEGKDVVAYGWDAHLAGFATSLLNWARSVTILTGGHRFEGDAAYRDVLARHGVRVEETPAVRMVGPPEDLQGVDLVDGRRVSASLLFFSVAHRPRTEVALQLGCEVDSDGYVRVDADGLTTTPGVYAAGDVVPGLQLVQVAAAQGTVAGVAAALSLQGQSGSPLSPQPAPDAIGEARRHSA